MTSALVTSNYLLIGILFIYYLARLWDVHLSCLSCGRDIMHLMYAFRLSIHGIYNWMQLEICHSGGLGLIPDGFI